MRKFLPVLMLLPALSGCGVDPLSSTVMTNLAMGGATVVSYSVLGQSPADYAISKYRGQHCDVRNPKKYDGLYCVDGRYELTPPEPTVYCYRSLGDADCSDQLDPYGNRNQPIVRNQPFGQRSPGDLTPADYNAAPIPAPAMLEPAGTTPVSRPASAMPAVTGAPQPLTPADMAYEGS